MHIPPTGWAALVSGVLGILAQVFLKAPARIKDLYSGLALVLIGGIAFAAYALAAPPAGPFNEWVMNGIMWAFGPAGVGSLAGQLGVAPKSNSH